MLDLGLDGVMEYTKTIGLYKTKSKHIMQTCRILLENTTAKCRKTARLWNRCLAWGAKRQTWY